MRAPVPDLPNTRDLELALVGCILTERADHLDAPDLWDGTSELIVSADVGRALRALRAWRDAGNAIDLCAAEQPMREAVGDEWSTFMLDCEQRSSRTVGWGVLRALREAAYRRRMYYVGVKLVETALYADDFGLRKAVQDGIDGMTRAGGSVNAMPLGVRQGLMAHCDVIAKRADGSLQGWTTGLRELDSCLRGLKPGEMSVLAARPSLGKSAICHQVALAVAKQGGHVLLASPEMSRGQVYDRMLAMVAQVEGALIATGRLSQSDWSRVAHGIQGVPETLHILDASHQTTWSIAAAARKHKLATNGGLDLLIVDHLGYVADDRHQGENRATQIGRMTKALKAIGRDLGCHVLLLSQLNRSSEEAGKMREPGLSDLRESGEVEQDADMVLLLHREDRNSMQATLIVAKNRQGPLGRVPLVFHGSTTHFTETEHHLG